MDSIAKLIGYVVLVLLALGWWEQYSKENATPSPQALSQAPKPPRERCKETATQQLVERITPELLQKTSDFGDRIRASTESCIYEAGKDTMIVTLRVGWHGPFSGDYYEKLGRLTVVGQSWSWTETGLNDNLRAWRLLTGIAAVLAASSSEAGTTDRAIYGFKLENACNRPIRVALRYADADGRWITSGWWDITANRTTTLLDHHSQPLRTRSSTWYYYAESADDAGLVWSGEHKFDFDGRSLAMHKLVDKEGDSEWKVTCS